MNGPDEKPRLAGLQVYTLIAQLRQNGATPAEIRGKLVAEGFDPQEAGALSDRLIVHETKKEIRSRAACRLAQGADTTELKANLAKEGYASDLVDQEVN